MVGRRWPGNGRASAPLAVAGRVLAPHALDHCGRRTCGPLSARRLLADAVGMSVSNGWLGTCWLGCNGRVLAIVGTAEAGMCGAGKCQKWLNTC
jgi:hypothetical protein